MGACGSAMGRRHGLPGARRYLDAIGAPTVSARLPGACIEHLMLVGNLDAVRRAIAAGADVDACDRYGNSPLEKAVAMWQWEVATELLAAGADPAPLRKLDRPHRLAVHSMLRVDTVNRVRSEG